MGSPSALLPAFTALILTMALVFVDHARASDKDSSIKPFVVIYLLFEDDEHYLAHRTYTGIQLNEPKRPLAGVQLALKETGILRRSLKTEFSLHELRLDSASDYIELLNQALDETGAHSVVLDVPLAPMLGIVNAFTDQNVLFFNARHHQDELRREQCHPQLFHTIPSYSMLTDALSQYLKSRDWTNILMLEGPREQDGQLLRAMQDSSRKFGLRSVGNEEFVISNNPRDRSQTNVPLLTGGEDHDVVFIADTDGEFARYVPYQTYSPNVVVGSEGLIPAAWHWTWERHGAPQLNQRFNRTGKRELSNEQWAGWAVVKSLVTALRHAGLSDFGSINTAIRSAELSVDLYKGAPGSFRPWNNQLRQPILLHTHRAVVQRAPLDGYLHQFNLLDTLGVDQSEAGCRF